MALARTPDSRETIDEQTYYYAVLLKNGNILRVSRITDSVVASALNLLPWLIAAAGVILGCLCLPPAA